MAWTGLAAVLVVSLPLTALAFPQPWFSHRVDHGHLIFYTDREIDLELDAVLREVAARVEAVELPEPAPRLRVFLISDPAKYSLFARLALVPSIVPGFNLSLAHNSFVSVAGIEARRLRNGGRFPYSALDGDLAQSVAHEVLHDYMVGETGFFPSLRLPRWKKEGYAEYGASRALIGQDDAVPLSQRIEIMLKEPMGHRAREYYSWGLVVEYLCRQQGSSHADVMREEVTLEAAYARMLEWHGVD